MASKNSGKSVMGNLPSTRPARIGGRRPSRNGEAAKPAAAKPKKAPARKTAAAKKPAATATKPTAPAKATKPRAVRSGSPALKAKRQSAPPRPEPATPPKGTEVVTTAVQAAGELAQIGLTLGGQMVKRAARRLQKR
jgi:hypothetical protein